MMQVKKVILLCKGSGQVSPHSEQQQNARKPGIKTLKASVCPLENLQPLKNKSINKDIPKIQTLIPVRHQDAKESLSYEEAQSIFLSREVIERFHLYPDFDCLAIGTLVRVRIGDESSSAYRISVVEDLKTCDQFYPFGNTTINRSCTVNHASNTTTFTFDYFSNSEFTEVEYNEWVSRCRANNVSTPSKRFANLRTMLLKQMAEATVTDSLINNILKRKALFCSSPSKRSLSEASDHSIEERETPKKKRKPDISYASFIKPTPNPSELSPFDAFSRRKCRPTRSF